MDIHHERFNELVDRYLAKACTREEFAELFAYIRNPAYDAILQQRMQEQQLATPETPQPQVDWEAIYSKITQQTQAPRTPVRRLPIRRVAAAAAILLIAAAGGWWWINQSQTPATPATQPVAQVQPVAHDIAPGTDKATLHLADGSTIEIDQNGRGTLATQGNTVVNQQGGQLSYETAKATDPTAAPLINTLRVPAGGKFMLMLPDSSKVWLNANSSLTYATAFTGPQREVTLSGEAYFEIARDKAHPFIVKSDRSAVKVLGTHFNVSAYADDQLHAVTLCEGAVQLTVGDRSSVLKPGEQASFRQQEDKIAIRSIDVEEAIDWKNGYFHFDNAGIEQVMNKIRRWYNIEVVYEGAKPSVKFTGMIARHEKLSRLLDLLRTTGGAQFEISNNQVIVKHK
ncbi:FecR family protein [Paraflavitalea pollutisoli]|uniref:FecR family protein n=1 Tax=Paraflavitalea pollutisoli TaxID=3034143 RepID=UPI0023EB61A2|nr:FecR family protein [Paraflavitalea sp. H1-2-19X]